MSHDQLTSPAELPATFSATLVRREKYAPFWGVLLKPLETLVSFLPSHRATRKGRANAKQVRVLIVAVGVAVMIFGGTLALILLGALVMASALFLPLSEVTKRAWRGKLRRLRTHRERDAKTKGRVVYDGKRLILYDGDQKLRRVLVDRGEHIVERRRRGEAACLGVRPPNRRKRESIWICAPGAPSSGADSGDDLGPDSDATAQNREEIARTDVDIWADVAPNDLAKIEQLLNR